MIPFQSNNNLKRRIKKKRNKLPEFELGKTANEGFELIGAFGRENSAIRRVGLRVSERGEKANQEIEEVDSQPIRDNVKTLHIEYPQNIDGCDDQGANPSVRAMGSGFVQIILEEPRKFMQVLVDGCTTTTTRASTSSVHPKFQSPPED